MCPSRPYLYGRARIRECNKLQISGTRQEVTPPLKPVLITVPQHSAVPTLLIFMTTQARVFPVPCLKFIYAQNSLGKEDSLTTAQLHTSATPFSTSFSAAHLGVCNISYYTNRLQMRPHPNQECRRKKSKTPFVFWHPSESLKENPTG